MGAIEGNERSKKKGKEKKKLAKCQLFCLVCLILGKRNEIFHEFRGGGWDGGEKVGGCLKKREVRGRRGRPRTRGQNTVMTRNGDALTRFFLVESIDT